MIDMSVRNSGSKGRSVKVDRLGLEPSDSALDGEHAVVGVEVGVGVVVGEGREVELERGRGDS